MKEKNDILFGFHSVYEALKAGKRNFYNILISKVIYKINLGK